MQRNLKTFAILYALPLLVAIISSARNNYRYNSKQWVNSGFGFNGLPVYAAFGFVGFAVIFAIVAIVVGLFISAMTYALQLEAAKGKSPSLQHLFNVAKKYWLRLFGLLLLVGIMTVGGLILFIVPGLIVIRRYFFAPYLMIDKDLPIGEAMRASAAMTKPYSGWIWPVIGVIVLLSLPNIIPLVGFGIAFVLSVLYSVAPALRYLEIKNLS